MERERERSGEERRAAPKHQAPAQEEYRLDFEFEFIECSAFSRYAKRSGGIVLWEFSIAFLVLISVGNYYFYALIEHNNTAAAARMLRYDIERYNR